MSRLELGYEFTCDLCGKTTKSKEYYDDVFTPFTVSATKPGWNFAQSLDICTDCFPTSGYFSDPPSKKSLPKQLIESILKYIRPT